MVALLVWLVKVMSTVSLGRNSPGVTDIQARAMWRRPVMRGPDPAWWLASCGVFLPALTKMTKGLW